MSRRSVLAAGSSGLAAFGTAGCLAGASDDGTTTGPPPDPVSLAGGKMDENGGMTNGEHHGPNGQVFYAEHSPDGHANPA